MKSKTSNLKKVYLDTNILAYWAIIEEEPEKAAMLSKKAQDCKKLLDMFEDGRIKCMFQTSDWALAELVQRFLDKALMTNFRFEGFEYAAYRRLKQEFRVGKGEINIILDALNDFENNLLKKFDVEILNLELNYHAVYQLVLKYSLETPDVLHVLIASRSDYLVTLDRALLDANIEEVEVISPAKFCMLHEIKS